MGQWVKEGRGWGVAPVGDGGKLLGWEEQGEGGVVNELVRGKGVGGRTCGELVKSWNNLRNDRHIHLAVCIVLCLLPPSLSLYILIMPLSRIHNKNLSTTVCFVRTVLSATCVLWGRCVVCIKWVYSVTWSNRFHETSWT